jgi:hypothetical protein
VEGGKVCVESDGGVVKGKITAAHVAAVYGYRYDYHHLFDDKILNGVVTSYFKRLFLIPPL